MTHALIAAKSGWGKNWIAQWWVEDNYERFPKMVILDRLDEFRGLAKARIAEWGVVGEKEATLPTSAWKEFIEQNERVILARHQLDGEDWKDVVAAVIKATMEIDDDTLVVLDEAHKVAPQKEGYPDPVETLATEGRGQVASVWMTQRLAKLDETAIGEMMIYLLGGFQSDADLRKIAGNVGYPSDVHKVSGGQIRGLPEELLTPDGENIPLRKFTKAGKTVGSEWVYSDDKGQLKRINSKDLMMDSKHYGREGLSLSVPG